jgi:hypothetical protein
LDSILNILDSMLCNSGPYLTLMEILMFLF